MECLENIIGISKTECECLLDQLPAGSDEIPDYNVSASGIFMDELQGFNIELASGADDCAKGGIWDRMYNAREQAILDYKREFLSLLGLKYKQRINNFSGQLGNSTFTGTASLSTMMAGQKITPNQIKGGFIYLKEVGIMINANANVVFNVYSNKNGSTLLYSSTPVPCTANNVEWAELSTSLELPMWDDSGLVIKYYVFMELNGTFQPKLNKKDCGCGSTEKEPWLPWLHIHGSTGSDTSNLEGFRQTNELNGIALRVEVKCKSSEIICSSQYPMDYENDANALNTAYAIRFRADAIVYGDLLKSTNINRFTMMNRDEIQKLVDEWNGMFSQWVSYVADNTENLFENGCWTCKEGKNDIIKRANIVV